MTELHPFLQEFKTEHASILADLKAHLDAGDWSAFFDYARTRVRHHEEREELVLLPAVSSKAGIRVGGPLCMLYFDMHCSSPPLERAANASGRPKLQPSETNVPAHLRSMYAENSPACIPLEDHFALAELAKAADAASEKELSFLGLTYFNILKFHFEKEDNCLFPMCQSLLSPAELDALMSASNSARVHSVG